MSKIEIDGTKYTVVESLGFNHDIGLYAKIVKDGDRERTAVKREKVWVFWTPADRVRPLHKAIERGWVPGSCPSVRGMYVERVKP